MAPLQGEGSRYQALVRTCPGSRDHVPGPGACLRGMTRAWVLLPSRVPLGIHGNRTPGHVDAATWIADGGETSGGAVWNPSIGDATIARSERHPPEHRCDRNHTHRTRDVARARRRDR